MKFGDTLWQRSVPQWRSYNVDYNNIKRLIKDNTSPGQGKAVSIPGTGDSVAKDFSNQLFIILNNEHDRISLFIKSRWYEINSRLASIGRQLSQIQGKDLATLNQRAAWQLRRRFSRIESEILAVGEEIQNLSRFISINRQAIKKLCKKYTKWSGSTNLRNRVESDILDKPGNLSEAMLKPALEQYTTFLHDVRAPFEGESERSPISPNGRSGYAIKPSPYAEILSKSALHFDSALTLRTKDRSTTVAKYWTHVDNVTQLRILLLQHTRLAKFEAVETRRTSVITLQRRASENADGEDNVGLILLGDLEMHGNDGDSYLQDENGSTGGARWSGNSEAVVYKTGAKPNAAAVMVAQVQQEQLYDYLDTRPNKTLSSSYDHNTDESNIRQWLEEHSNMRPLACIRSRRSRFVGLDNTLGGGTWATLDEEIDMAPVSLKQLKNTDFYRCSGQQANRFEHAVLTVRSEGDDRGLLRMLDKSHLTERIDDFSIEQHALYQCHRPRSMATPTWIDTLHKDIRHVPEAPPTTRSRKSSSFGLSTPRRSPRTSVSQGRSTPPTTVTTIAAPDPSTLETRVKSKLRQKRRLQTPITEETQPYWNEYDNPDSEFGGDDGGFVIYIDPDAPLYPGQKMVSRMYNSIRSLLGLKGKQPDLERQNSSETLTGSTGSSEDEEDDVDKIGRPSVSAKTPLIGRLLSPGYGATPHPPTTTQRNTTSTAAIFTPNIHTHLASSTRLSTICLAAALIILAMVNVLSSTGRKKARTEIETFVLIGVIAALAFAGIGMGNLITVGIRGGLMRKKVVFLAFRWVVALVVCVWAGWLGMSVIV